MGNLLKNDNKKSKKRLTDSVINCLTLDTGQSYDNGIAAKSACRSNNLLPTKTENVLSVARFLLSKTCNVMVRTVGNTSVLPVFFVTGLLALLFVPPVLSLTTQTVAVLDFHKESGHDY